MNHLNMEPVIFFDAQGAQQKLSSRDGAANFIWVPAYDSNDLVVGYRPQRVIPGVAIVIPGPEFADGQPIPCCA